MKNARYLLLTFLCILLAYSTPGFAQNSAAKELRFNVDRVYSHLSITKEKLKEAHTIRDFKNAVRDNNLDYKPSWVKEYISVEISTIYNGRTRTAVSKDDTLTQEQKDYMFEADPGTDISVNVKYIPDNTLKHNDPKELNFTVAVGPEKEATYPGGEQQLKKYLQEKAIDQISAASFENFDLVAIKFTINEEGEIVNAYLFGDEYRSEKNEKRDALLLEAIRNMPCWRPAQYADGTEVKQEFVFTVGNMESCVINLLNIRRD